MRTDPRADEVRRIVERVFSDYFHQRQPPGRGHGAPPAGRFPRLDGRSSSRPCPRSTRRSSSTGAAAWRGATARKATWPCGCWPRELYNSMTTAGGCWRRSISLNRCGPCGWRREAGGGPPRKNAKIAKKRSGVLPQEPGIEDTRWGGDRKQNGRRPASKPGQRPSNRPRQSRTRNPELRRTSLLAALCLHGCGRRSWQSACFFRCHAGRLRADDRARFRGLRRRPLCLQEPPCPRRADARRHCLGPDPRPFGQLASADDALAHAGLLAVWSLGRAGTI